MKLTREEFQKYIYSYNNDETFYKTLYLQEKEHPETFHEYCLTLDRKKICDTSKVITNKPKKMRPGSYCPAQNVQHKILIFHRRMRFFPSPCQACFSAPGLKSAARLP